MNTYVLNHFASEFEKLAQDNIDDDISAMRAARRANRSPEDTYRDFLGGARGDLMLGGLGAGALGGSVLGALRRRSLGGALTGLGLGSLAGAGIGLGAGEGYDFLKRRYIRGAISPGL